MKQMGELSANAGLWYIGAFSTGVPLYAARRSIFIVELAKNPLRSYEFTFLRADSVLK
jgi:hypothetical protein